MCVDVDDGEPRPLDARLADAEHAERPIGIERHHAGAGRTARGATRDEHAARGSLGTRARGCRSAPRHAGYRAITSCTRRLNAKCLVVRTLPQVAAEDDARRARSHTQIDLADGLIRVHLAAAREQHETAARGPHDALQTLPGVLLQRSIGFRTAARLVVRFVQLDDVGAHLFSDAGSVVDRIQRALPAPRFDRTSSRVRPDDHRHAEALGVLAHLLELEEFEILSRRADIERVADRVRAQSDGILDRGIERRHRLVVFRDVRLAVELQDERDAAAVVLEVLLGQADAQRDRRVPPLDRQAALERRVDRRRIREEIRWSVLESLVERHHEQRAVPRAIVVEQAAQAHLLAETDREVVEA